MRTDLNLGPDIVVDGPSAQRYVSAQRTGTGQEESITHGLGTTPTDVQVTIEYLPALADVATVATTLITQGTHTTTAIKLTVLSGAKYRVRAQP